MMTPCQRCGTPFPTQVPFCPTCGLARTPSPPGQVPPVQPLPAGALPPGGALAGPGWPGAAASPGGANWPHPGQAQQGSPQPFPPGLPQQGFPPGAPPPGPSLGVPAGPPPIGAGQPFLPGEPALAPGPAGVRIGGKGRGGGRSKRRRVVLIGALALVLVVVIAALAGYFLYQANAPTSYVIATDRGNGELARIALATRSRTVLISNKALPAAPDSVVFLSSTQVLIDFAGNRGDIGLGDIQNGTYTTISGGHNDLRDMAVRPDGSGVLIAEMDGVLFEYRVSDRSVRMFVQSQNLSGVQGLAFDSAGNLYAAVGGSVVQLDPENGKQIKTFPLPGGSDGMAYDQHRKTLDIATGDAIEILDPKTGKVNTLLDGIAGADGVAIDRQGNLFIAANAGVLELNMNNQLLIVGPDSNGATWDDVAPLSGSGAVNY